jgi:tripartite-type tricarboxylate transporter receptor subunit TctC
MGNDKLTRPNRTRSRKDPIMLAVALPRTILAAAAMLVAVPALAPAQSDYPNHTVKIVVPVPPGGFADALPRMMAEQLSAKWHQPVVIENRPGAGLNLAAEFVSKSAPDGYTLLATPPAPLVTSQALYPKLGFDPNLFVPVTLLAKGPFLLITRPTLPVSTLAEFIAYAKANPGKLNYASTGPGSPPHLAAELLQTKAGLSFGHVQYKGLTPALTDVMGGHVDLMFHDFASTGAQIKAGTVKALGVGDSVPLPELPNVPAMGSVLPGFTAGFWYAVVAPPRTPASLANAISRAMADALHSPEVTGRMRKFSLAPAALSPDETAAFIKAESARMRDLIAVAGIKPLQ